MTDQDNDNIQRGLAEIWRREKLLIAGISLLGIFGIAVAIPASFIWFEYAHLIVMLVPVIILVKVWFWVSSTPCPSCGKPYGGLRVQKKCERCGIELLREKPADYKISFKEIKYQSTERARK